MVTRSNVGFGDVKDGNDDDDDDDDVSMTISGI